MSFPRYERYKDSGVEWLGEVPEHWKVFALKRIANLQSGDSIAPEAIEPTGEYPVYGGNGLRGFTTSFTHTGTYALIGRQGALCGNINYASGQFWASEHAIIVTPMSSVDTTWLGELLREMNLNQYSIASAQPGLSVDNIRKLLIAVPTLAEQQAVGQFLRRETAKIDALIEEQRRLIELLKEKRQAVISHAVTKGINCDAEMTNSGFIELAEVPKHWKITPLGYFSRLHRGHDLTSDQQEEGPYPVVTSGGITGFHSAYIAKAPGVVTGRYGSTGRLFYIEENYWPHNTSLYVSDFFRNDPRFVWYSLQAINFESHSAKSAVPGIDRNDLHVLPVAVPPKEEQTAIVRHLDILMQEFDSLSAEAHQATNLLHERRSALISAAVTGKIDVRNYTPKEAA
jgi:type I restriction enzyme S subunit